MNCVSRGNPPADECSQRRVWWLTIALCQLGHGYQEALASRAAALSGRAISPLSVTATR